MQEPTITITKKALIEAILPSDEDIRLKCYMSRDTSLENTYVAGFNKGAKYLRQSITSAIEKMEESNGWISVEYGLPTKTGKYLFYDTKQGIPIIEFFTSQGKQEYLKKYYTHWQLIEPPKQ